MSHNGPKRLSCEVFFSPLELLRKRHSLPVRLGFWASGIRAGMVGLGHHRQGPYHTGKQSAAVEKNWALMVLFELLDSHRPEVSLSLGFLGLILIDYLWLFKLLWVRPLSKKEILRAILPKSFLEMRFVPKPQPTCLGSCCQTSGMLRVSLNLLSWPFRSVVSTEGDFAPKGTFGNIWIHFWLS